MRTGIVASLATVMLGAAANSHAIVVGGFEAPRTLVEFGSPLLTYSIYAPGAGRDELLAVSNSLLYGDSILFAPPTTLATNEYLKGVDVFFTGLIDNNSLKLSKAETQALVRFIRKGGVVVAHGDNSYFFDETVDDLLNEYGLDVVNGKHAEEYQPLFIVNGTHPVMNGPFGVVAKLNLGDSAYLAPIVGPGGGQILASYVPRYGEEEPWGAIGVVDPAGKRRGGLLFLPAAENFGLANPVWPSEDFRILFNNGIAWSIKIAKSSSPVPEPSTLVLLGLGLAGLGLSRRRRAA